MDENDRDWPTYVEPPYWRDYEPQRSSLWAWLLVALLAIAAGAGYYFWQEGGRVPRFSFTPKPAPLAETPPAEPEKPAIRHPVPEVEAEPEKPLPTLERSDTVAVELVAGLVDKKAFDSFV